jgi:hypothetical protein
MELSHSLELRHSKPIQERAKIAKSKLHEQLQNDMPVLGLAGCHVRQVETMQKTGAEMAGT